MRVRLGHQTVAVASLVPPRAMQQNTATCHSAKTFDLPQPNRGSDPRDELHQTTTTFRADRGPRTRSQVAMCRSAAADRRPLTKAWSALVASLEPGVPLHPGLPPCALLGSVVSVQTRARSFSGRCCQWSSLGSDLNLTRWVFPTVRVSSSLVAWDPGSRGLRGGFRRQTPKWPGSGPRFSVPEGLRNAREGVDVGLGRFGFGTWHWQWTRRDFD